MSSQSRAFRDEIPYKRHLVRRSKGGVNAEVANLRDDIDFVFYELEQSGQLAEYHVDTVDPVVTNDSSQGFTRYSRWINTSSPAREFVCLDASVGAADWKETTGTIPGGAVASVFGRTGNVISALGDYLASQITNDSLVAGATVEDALNALLAAIPLPAAVSSVFGRVGTVVAFAGDYTSTQINNLSTVAGANVTSALNALKTDKVDLTRSITAGVGLVGGGDLSADRLISVNPHIDGSISATVAGTRVGVLATDAQHGTKGGGTLHAVATTSVAGFMSPADKGKLDTLDSTDVVNASVVPGVTVTAALDYLALTVVSVPVGRMLTAGAGLVGGGDLAADRTFDVVAHADGSIIVNPDDIQVGVLANDSQHGARGGGTQHSDVSITTAGFMSAADKVKLDGLPTSVVPDSRVLTAGAGLTGGGNLAADRTFDVVANADGSILVNSNDIQVGILATDTQHGLRGGGNLHDLASMGSAGFMSAADKVKLDALASESAPAVLIWGASSVSGTTTTRYLYPGFVSALAQTSMIMFRVPRAGKIRKMRVHHNGTAGNGNAIVYTLRVEGVATALAVSIASTTSEGADNINSVTVANDDRVDIQVTKAVSVGASPSDVVVSVEFASD